MKNAVAEKEGVAAYEVAFNFNGVPFQLVPRAGSEIESQGGSKFQLLSVNESEQKARPCRDLVVRSSGKWRLGNSGTQLLDLLTYGSY